MSFPFTTRLSLDLRRSLVSISKPLLAFTATLYHMNVPTVSSRIQVNDAANAHIDNAQKALILLLELLLVEDLDCENALLGDFPVLPSVQPICHTSSPSHPHVKALVPIRVERLLDHARGSRLLAADSRDRKWVRKSYIMCKPAVHIPDRRSVPHTEDIALVQSIRRNDCRLLAPCSARHFHLSTYSSPGGSLAREVRPWRLPRVLGFSSFCLEVAGSRNHETINRHRLCSA